MTRLICTGQSAFLEGNKVVYCGVYVGDYDVIHNGYEAAETPVFRSEVTLPQLPENQHYHWHGIEDWETYRARVDIMDERYDFVRSIYVDMPSGGEPEEAVIED